jgi:hypothetical protein
MVGRALNLAAAVAVFCMMLANGAAAQENLDAGKSPSQLYNGTCVVCHKSPRGLAKNTSASSLPGFLRQHYTTSPEMAGVLANYLISNGATDARYMGHSGKDGKETRSERRARSVATEPAEAKPEAVGQAEPRRRSRHHSKRSDPAAPAEPKPEAGADSKDPVAGPADGEGSAPGKKGKVGKRKKPAQEGAAADETRSESTGAIRPSPARDDNAARAEPPKLETPRSSDAAPSLRADPVPPVTPAPATTQSVDPSVPSSPSR